MQQYVSICSFSLNNARFFGILEQIGLKIYIEEEMKK